MASTVPRSSSVRKRVELRVKELLKHPNKNGGYYSFTTGEVAELPEPWQRLQQSKGYMYKLTPDPADTVDCTLDDLYEYEVEVFVNHPLIIFNELREGPPCCPKCKRTGSLQGNGVCLGTHTVLDKDGQIEVISFCIRCLSCPEHGGKDYNFNTSDEGFLRANFPPVIFDYLPWELWTSALGVTKELADMINLLRPYGTSALEIANDRNRLLANRILRRIKMHLNFRRFKQLSASKPKGIMAFLQKPATAAEVAAVAVTPSARAGASVASAGSCAAMPKRHTVKGSSGKQAAQKSLGQRTLDKTWEAARAALSSLSPKKRPRTQDGAQAAGNGTTVDKEQAATAGTSAAGCGRSAAAAAGNPAGAAAAAGNPAGAAAAAGNPAGAAAAAGNPAGAAAAAGSSAAAGSVEPGAGALDLAISGPWHVHGFGFKKLTSNYVTEVYQQLMVERSSLQRRILRSEQAAGFISLDHVMDPGKRIQGDTKAMLVACGASGNVLDWWCTTSTSLQEVAADLQQLDKQQMEAVHTVTVDDPRSMEEVLTSTFPDSKIKMDVGHVIFSRLGKLLDKTHANYSAAVKGLAMCFFEFNSKDLQAFLKSHKAKHPQYSRWGDKKLVDKLPLSTFKRHVRRIYSAPAAMAQQMLAWYQDFVVVKAVDLLGTHIVSGGAKGLEAFDKCFNNQLQLANNGYLTDPPDVDMYYLLGTTKGSKDQPGLINIKAKRGSSKNEAVNRVIETSLNTTGKMAERTAYGICSDRFTDYNFKIKSTFARHGQLQQHQQTAAVDAATALGLTLGQHLDSFEYCQDPVLGYSVNSLCLQLGGSQIIPLMDSNSLASVDEVAMPPLQRKVPNTLPPGMEEVPDLLEEIDAEFDETLLAAAVTAEFTAVPPQPAGSAAAVAAGSAAAVAAGSAAAVADQEAAHIDGISPTTAQQPAAAAAVAPASADAVSPRAYGKRAASARIRELVDAEAASFFNDDMDRDCELSLKRRRTTLPAVGADPELLGDHGTPGVHPDLSLSELQSKAAAVAAVAAAAAAARSPKRKGGSSKQTQKSGSSSPQNTGRHKPRWVKQRVMASRELHYKDFIAPVKTDDEKALFMQLMQQHTSGSRQSVDWVAFTLAWNMQAFDNMTDQGGKIITFKQEAHLRQYNKEVSKNASKMQFAAFMAAAAAERGDNLQQHQADPKSVLQQILLQCLQQQQQVQHSVDVYAALEVFLQDLQQLFEQARAASAAPTVSGDGNSGDAVTPQAAAAGVLGSSFGPISAPATAALPGGSTVAARGTTSATGATAKATVQPAAAATIPAAASRWAALLTPPGAAAGSSKKGKSKQPTAPGAGRGKGGAGGSKTCVPCTMHKYSLASAEEARAHPHAVIVDGAHMRNGCKYCKCDAGKEAWNRVGVTNWAFREAKDCSVCQYKRSRR